MTNNCASKTLYRLIQTKYHQIMALHNPYEPQHTSQIQPNTLNRPPARTSMSFHHNRYNYSEYISKRKPSKSTTKRIIEHLNKSIQDSKITNSNDSNRVTKSTSNDSKKRHIYKHHRKPKKDMDIIEEIKQQIYDSRYKIYSNHVKIVNDMKQFLIRSGTALGQLAIKKILYYIDYFTNLIATEEEKYSVDL